MNFCWCTWGSIFIPKKYKVIKIDKTKCFLYKNIYEIDGNELAMLEGYLGSQHSCNCIEC